VAGSLCDDEAFDDVLVEVAGADALFCGTGASGSTSAASTL
jgi:hypothetical protein